MMIYAGNDMLQKKVGLNKAGMALTSAGSRDEKQVLRTVEAKEEFNMTMMMNKKAKIVLAILVMLACLWGRSGGGPVAEASFKVPVSATVQEGISRTIIRNEEVKLVNSAEAQEMLPHLIAQQKRIMDYNGLELSEQPFQRANDYKTKVHPAELAVSSEWSGLSVGAGHIFIDFPTLRNRGFADRRNLNHYDLAYVQQLLAHEITHSITGASLPKMGLFIALRSGHESRKEEIKAERGSVKLLENVPEGGWGSYTVSVHRVNYSEDKYQRAANYVLEDFEKATQGRIRFNRFGKKHQEGRTAYYVAGDGLEYRIEGGYCMSNRHNNRYDATYYLSGQIAECIAAGAFRPENLRVFSQAEMPSECRFAGDCMLVCMSDKLPHGWKALASLYDISKSAAQDELNELRQSFARSPRLSRTDGYDGWLQKVGNGNLSYQGSRYLLAEVVALACDNVSRKK